ncbi:putative uncharacterized protein DDB_G0271606 isoform X5 [Drosophila novamexicana]|uniref:putative uncharacterized protein DDB_G0271606 isoform X5 n=1 Tax=Drosophila novamexicana TaxID=47314 RepID=UPI0011E5C442|nr:putative uncharacterized protein DDB_G0271606 isoform X5 [Drosophila novamexicana]
MDSEAVTKLSETENTELVKDSKESVPPEATDTTKDQKSVDKNVNEEVASVDDGNESRHTEIKTTTTIVTTKKDNGDEGPLTETQTTTTVVVTKKDSGEETSQKETETTSSTVVIAKKAEDGLAPIKDNVSNVDNSQIKAETKESQLVKPELISDPVTETAETINKSGSQSSIPDTSTDAAEQNVSASERKEEEESEEGDSTSDDEDLGEETEAKIEKNKDDRDESQSEVVAVHVKKAQDSTEKINNANKDINNQIENIISDIDINIKAQEKITQLKEQELQLIQKQKELASQIQQQQLLAQKLFAQNQLKEQELKAQQYQQNQLKEQELRAQQYQKNQLKEQELRAQQYRQNQLKEQELRAQQYEQQNQFHSPNEYKEEIAPKVAQDYTRVHSQQEDSYDKKESSNLSRTVDLRKIFTPATDAPEILPKNHYQQYQARPATSPSILPAYSDAGKHRVQLNLHQDQLIEKYSKPGVQVVKSPWEAALQTGSASAAFLEDSRYQNQTPITSQASPVHFNQDVTDFQSSISELPSRQPAPYCASSNNVQDPYKNLHNTRVQSQANQPPSNPQRELAYKPSVAQGWGGRNVELPREYYWQSYQQQCETQNTDDMSEYYYSNEHVLVDPKAYGANITNNSNNYFTDDIEHRLLQLEQFQKCFMQQQRLGLNIGIKHGMPEASGQRNETTDMYRKNKESEIAPDNTNLSKCKEDITKNIAEVTDPVNVRELIFSFEQQSLREHEGLQKNRCEFTTDIRRSIDDNSKSQSLYVPKEISLASYAPPPVQQHTSNFQTPTKADFSKGYLTSHVGDAPSGFPISNPTTGLYSSVPPKQQLYAPASYQKVPPSSVQAAPQVNFNPSPLSFDKLSKFQESNQRNSGVSTQRYLNANKQPAYTNVRNASPTPFTPGGIGDRAGFDNIQRSTFSSTPSNYGQNAYSPESHQLRAPGQCFNNSARGWSQASNSQRNFLSSKVPLATEGLPYSDF